jgi:hypothetical protein
MKLPRATRPSPIAGWVLTAVPSGPAALTSVWLLAGAAAESGFGNEPGGCQPEFCRSGVRA